MLRVWLNLYFCFCFVRGKKSWFAFFQQSLEKKLTFLFNLLLKEFEYAGEKVLNDQLPTFPNLKRLELRCGVENFFWDKLILPFLNCSPALETLVFTEVSVWFWYHFTYSWLMF